MARRHAILAALVVAAALWAYFIVHPLGGGAPGPEHKVTVWQVPLRQVTGLTYREGPLRATLEPRWEPGAAKPYLWIDSEMELHGPPGAKAKGGKTPPDQAKPERDHIAFKGNATAQQVLAQFANLTADRDLGPLSGLEAKDFGLPEQDAFVEVARGDAPALPLTNISKAEIDDYIGWLSRTSGFDYRLPTSAEWQYAADAAGSGAGITNYNCKLGGGTGKGDALLPVTTGDGPNAWGLWNFIGNAQELVSDGGGVVARGGSINDRYETCSISLAVPHNGQADPVTSFRLVRKLGVGE